MHLKLCSVRLCLGGGWRLKHQTSYNSITVLRMSEESPPHSLLNLCPSVCVCVCVCVRVRARARQGVEYKGGLLYRLLCDRVQLFMCVGPIEL